MVWANEQGGLCCMLVCGHQTQWVFRGHWGYTPVLDAYSVDSRQINLEQRQCCFVAPIWSEKAKASHASAS